MKGGIFIAGPRRVPTVRVLAIISPEEATELTYHESGAITMERVVRSPPKRGLVNLIQKKIPTRIKNVRCELRDYSRTVYSI